MEKTRLFVDVDGTLAVFKYVDTLETLYEQGYFLNLEPNMNVVDAVKILSARDDVELFIMSSVLSDSKYALNEKNEWIDKYLPQIDKSHRIFPPCGDDKKDYIPEGVRTSDCLLDDYTHNLTAWQPPAKGVKLLNGINHTRGSWQHSRLDYNRSSKELANDLVSIMNGEIIKDEPPVVNNAPNQDVIVEMDEEQLIDMVYEDGMMLRHIPKERQTDDICKTAVFQNGMALQYVAKQDLETCQIALQENGMARQFVKEPTEQLDRLAVSGDGMALQFVEDKTWRICETAYSSNKASTQFMPEDMKKCFEQAFDKVIHDSYELKAAYKDLLEQYIMIAGSGIKLWTDWNFKENCIYTVNEDGDIGVIDKDAASFSTISYEKIYQEAENLLRDGYPVNIIVGTITYHRNGLAEEIIYFSANDFHKDIENADWNGERISVQIYEIKGKSIYSQNLKPENFDHVVSFKSVSFDSGITNPSKKEKETEITT